MTAQKSVALSTALEVAHDLADLSAKAILPQFRKAIAVEDKGGAAGFDPVTAADKAAERVIRRALAQRFPDHGIVGEEFGARDGAGRYRWIIDPIDGTKAFVMGLPTWGTLIGLTDDGQPLLGLMNQPYVGERFWGSGGSAHVRGAQGRTRRLRTRACPRLGDAILSATTPAMFKPGHERAAFDRLSSQCRMTRFGSDCYAYCLLAAGLVDLVVESGLKTVDIAPLIPIIEGAGGVVTDWTGGPAVAGGRVVAAGDARLHRRALDSLAG